MELMERVREIGAEAPTVTAAGLDGAREALLREIAREERRDAEPVRRRRARWIGGSALAGGLAAAALVIGFVAVPATAPTASAAARVLEKAAETAAETPETALAPGQYLRVATTFDQVQPWDADGDRTWFARAANVDDAEAVVVVRGVSAMYLPADRDGDWITERDYGHVAESFGPEAAAAVDVWMATAGGDDGLNGARLYPGGAAIAGDGTTYYLDDRDVYADAPTDPQALLDWLRERASEPGNSESEVNYTVAAEMLGDIQLSSLAPAPVRGAMLRALSLVDGITVASVDGDVTTLDYRWQSDSGIARMTFDLDTVRGLIIAVTNWGTTTDGLGSLDGSPEWRSRTMLDISVVDAAPAATLPSP